MMKATVEQLDPELAELLLGKLIENRRIRATKVKQFADDMREGRWRLTGEAIKLTDSGDLVDGEHRLRAIIASGTTIETLVIYGATVDDRVAMDSGTPRTLTDHLNFLHEERSSELAAALIALHARRSSIPWRADAAASRQEYLLLLEEHPRIRDSVVAVSRTVRLLRIPRGVAAALHYDMVALSADDADDFWSRLHSGANMHERHPVLVLRRRLEENASAVGRKFDRTTLHAFIIKGWNAYRAGRDISIIRWKRGGANPEAFPELE